MIRTENGRHFHFPMKTVHIVTEGRRTKMDSFGQRKTLVTFVLHNIYYLNMNDWLPQRFFVAPDVLSIMGHGPSVQN